MSPEREKWNKAIQEEIRALKKNDTWELVDVPIGIKPLTIKWVFQKKKTECGTIKYKARLVAKRCAQIYGRDYSDVFSSVVKYETIRFLLALAATENWKITQMNVTTAYLNSELKEKIYLKPPEGVTDYTDGKIWRLKRAIYGLKQSGRA